MNFHPIFAVSSKEHQLWTEKKGNIYETPKIHSLSELAEMVYESGYVIGNDSLLGHLASNLHIPSLIIANDRKRMRLWRPGWLKGEVITPSNTPFCYLLLKLNRSNWKHTISVKEALSIFKKLSLNT
jgi:ADP-heptose:LPS heptosyltransferase